MTATATVPFENGTLRLRQGGAVHLVSDRGPIGHVAPLCAPTTRKPAVEEAAPDEPTCQKCIATRDGVVLGGRHGWVTR